MMNEQGDKHDVMNGKTRSLHHGDHVVLVSLILFHYMDLD